MVAPLEHMMEFYKWTSTYMIPKYLMKPVPHTFQILSESSDFYQEEDPTLLHCRPDKLRACIQQIQAHVTRGEDPIYWLSEHGYSFALSFLYHIYLREKDENEKHPDVHKYRREEFYKRNKDQLLNFSDVTYQNVMTKILPPKR